MSGINAQAWLAIASGGKWSRAEVRAEIRSATDKQLDQSLRVMVDNGMLTRFDDGTYGVTHECTIPRGMTVAEVLRATGALA